jgi:hypothetical protein
LLPVALLLLVPAQALPAETSFSFEEEVQSWGTFMEGESRDEMNQEADIKFQSSTELFPSGDEELDGAGRLEDLRDERIAQFVSVMIDGSLVALHDVPRTAWFAPYVREIAERGIVSGYRDESGQPTGAFGPADNVTIEQMAKVMLYASGLDAQSCSGVPLNATASGSWSAQFVACAEKIQWSVYADGSVDVHRPATRSEVIATLLQAFKVTPEARTGDTFTDVTLTTLFGASIEQAKRDGIVSGYTDDDGTPTNTFGPEDPVTRAEFAKIVTLGMQVYK